MNGIPSTVTIITLTIAASAVLAGFVQLHGLAPEAVSRTAKGWKSAQAAQERRS